MLYEKHPNIKEISAIIKTRLETDHIGCFEGMTEPLLLISTQYPGIWLEHIYDSVFYAMIDSSKLYLAENAIKIFIENQKENGQLPCAILNKARIDKNKNSIGYGQIQECVSFAKLALMVYRMNGSKSFLNYIYSASQKWAGWLENNRMTMNKGMIEMFVGFDTGHDNSGRLCGLSCKCNYTLDGVKQNAAILPKDDAVAPVIAVDMNCNFYATLMALSEMAKELGLCYEAEKWANKASVLKKRIFEVCFNKEDCFFYDVDKNGNQRKYLSSTIFHLFMEGVLDKNEDVELIDEIYTRHISNPEEFATPYPYPSMAINDPSCKNRPEFNSWGYYTQGLIALRTTLWMEKYGFNKDFDNLCNRWLKAWTEHFDEIKLGQELDPVTGVPTKSSEWYSSTMLFYFYAATKN